MTTKCFVGKLNVHLVLVAINADAHALLDIGGRNLKRNGFGNYSDSKGLEKV
jgi:hypothetical protein